MLKIFDLLFLAKPSCRRDTYYSSIEEDPKQLTVPSLTHEGLKPFLVTHAECNALSHV